MQVKLNPQQSAVACAKGNRTIVLAGAGTGKTASAVNWVANKLQSGVNPENVAMLTFTRKAAKEMQNRLISLVGNEGKGVWAGTYHAIAARLFRYYPHDFHVSPKFTILDEDDALGIMRSAFRLCGFKPKTPLTPANVRNCLSLGINTRTGFLDNAEQFDLLDFDREFKIVVEQYTLLKQQADSLDYDDLLTTLLTGLQAHAGNKVRSRLSHLLVDEFQDNNQLNYAILQAWNPDSLMVIGDKQQSIYRFRGADASLVDQFITTTPDVTLLKLETNYRSGQDLLDRANQIIARNKLALTLTANPGNFSEVRLTEFENPKQEAIAVTKSLQSQLKHTTADEIAVLARTGRAFMPLELELRKAKIPYKKYGGVAITDNSEIKDFLSILRLVHNPKDSIALIRALCLFPGVGKGAAEKVGQKDPDELALDIQKWPEKAKQLQIWLKELQAMHDLELMGAYTLEKITPLIQSNYPEDFVDRIQSLEELVQIMQDEKGTLQDFLEIFVLDRGFEREHPKDNIVLSTVHSAKGLEWDTVYLFNYSSNLVPHPRAVTRQEQEEERRLLYVSVTRARYLLEVSSNLKDGGLTHFWR